MSNRLSKAVQARVSTEVHAILFLSSVVPSWIHGMGTTGSCTTAEEYEYHVRYMASRWADIGDALNTLVTNNGVLPSRGPCGAQG